jgi:N6-adenosine-specific RNA methylase IME4
MSSNAVLAIPDPFSQDIAEGWGLAFLDVADRIDDLGQLDNGRAELAGYVSAYRKKGKDARELQIGERVTEIRMGELLGPANSQGQRSDLTSSDQRKLPVALNDGRVSEFRALAANRAEVLMWLKGGTIGRSALLARITAKNAGYTLSPVRDMPRCAVLYADPPWAYDHNEASGRDIENHYTTMGSAAIAALGGPGGIDVPAAANSVLFLWATNPKLAEALDVMAAWGFSYRTNMAWVKDRIGMGYYARAQHELLLIGKRGDLPMPDPSARPASVVTAPRGAHSRKPEVFYELIETMYAGLPKVELFARVTREGWHSWGFEAH